MYIGIYCTYEHIVYEWGGGLVKKYIQQIKLNLLMREFISSLVFTHKGHFTPINKCKNIFFMDKYAQRYLLSFYIQFIICLFVAMTRDENHI